MSKTEEIALARLGAIAADPQRPKFVETSVLRQIVADNRAPMHPAAPAAPQGVVGAAKVITGNDGVGWTNSPKVDDWRPPGLQIMDRLVDQQDRIDRAEREAQLAKLKQRGGAG
jgi:hypothetical protein